MADTKIEKCPNCGGSNMWPQCGIEMYKVICYTCGYMSGDRPTKAEAVAAHNKVSRANAIAEAYHGLFDEVEATFAVYSLEHGMGGTYPVESMDPMWKAYNAVLDAEE